MMIPLYRSENVVTQLKLDESSKRNWQLMGEDTISLEIEVSDPISFQVGDYIEHEGQRFTLNTIPQLSKAGHNIFSYTAVFESTMYDLGKVQFLLFTDDPVNPAPLGSFDLTGTAQVFAEQIIVNLNRLFTGWSILGTIPETDYRNLYFEGVNCLSALHRVCEEFGMEFVVNGKTITLGYDLGTVHTRRFKYGRGNGLYDLRRVSIDSKEVITRLYAFGSERNIPSDYRNYSPRLKLPNDYVEKSVATYGVIEHTEIFEDIYPTRKGTISWVDPSNYLIFQDSGMDFNLNDYLLSGLSAKIHFLTGVLAGYSFELNATNGYIDNLKQFTMIVNTDEKDFQVPSESLKPEVGDQYVLLDILMPQTYIDAAEAKLAQRAQEFIDKYSNPQVSYQLTIDPIYLQRNPITIVPGDWVKIGDAEVAIFENVRVLGISFPLLFPNRLEVQLADEAQTSVEQLIFREQQKLAAMTASANAKYASLSLLASELSRLKFIHELFEKRNDGTTDYIQAKLDLFGAKGIRARSSTEASVPSIWDSLPTASNIVKGAVKVGSGLRMNGDFIEIDGDTFNLSNYFTKIDSDGRYGIKSAENTWAENNTFSKNLTVNGNLYVNGTEFIANTQTVQIEDNLAIINYGEVGAGITAGFAGWQVDRGTADDFLFGFSESPGYFQVGKVGAMQTVATREDSPTANHYAKWNNTLKRFDTALPTFAEIASKPTTLGGYGITDAASATHTHQTTDIVSGRFVDDRMPLRLDYRAVTVSGDWDTHVNSGWYNGSLLTNAPSGGHSWKYVMAIRHYNSSDYVSQTAWDFTSGRMWIRAKSGGWSSWSEVITDNTTQTISGAKTFSNDIVIRKAGSTSIAMLDIKATSDRARFRLISETDQPTDIVMGSNNVTRWSLTSRGSSEDYRLGIYNYVRGSYELSINGSNGYVGLGTTTAQNPLDIYAVNNTATMISVRDRHPTITTLSYNLNINRFGIEYAPVYSGTGRTSSNMVISVDGTWINTGYGHIILTPKTNVGIGTTTPSEKLTVNGNIIATGSIGARVASDRFLKERINPLTHSLDIIDLLNPISHYWNDTAKALNTTYSDQKSYGVIAQELEEVMPELVYSIYHKYKGVDYIQMIPILIGAIKELKKEVDQLKKN